MGLAGPVTYGFRLTAVFSPRERLGSHEQTVEIDLGPPIGCVTLRAFPGGSFREAGELLFSGRGYATHGEAEQAGRALKNVIRLAAVEVGKGLDVGQDTVRGRAGQVVIEDYAGRGLQLLPDVHGLQVYEEVAKPVVLLMRGEGTVVTPLDRFTGALRAQAEQAAGVTESRALACDLFVQSRFESSLKSRVLTLVTALEVLSERRERSGVAARLVEEFREAIKRAAGEADGEERRQLDSLLGAANDLRLESIGTAIRELAEPVPASELVGDRDGSGLARASYVARSQLTHDGVTSHDLVALFGPLQSLVRRLCIASDTEIGAAERN